MFGQFLIVVTALFRHEPLCPVTSPKSVDAEKRTSSSIKRRLVFAFRDTILLKCVRVRQLLVHVSFLA